MREIVEWLIFIEDWASRLYEQSSHLLKQKESVRFCERLASDEAMHSHFMNRALAFIDQHPELITEITLDQNTVRSIEAPLVNIEEALKSGVFNESNFYQSLVDSELSEWNDIFLYIVNSIKDKGPKLKAIAPSIQNHLRIIEAFLNRVPDASAALNKIESLSTVWEEKILIVDDSEPISDLLESILGKVGQVHTANNGAEALRRVEKEYYAVIISDVDMPVMDGIKFYRKIKEVHPEISQRFIFISGNIDPLRKDFFENEHLTFFEKPFSISDIKFATNQILDRISL